MYNCICKLCSHFEWFLLKCPVFGLGFDGAKTNNNVGFSLWNWMHYSNLPNGQLQQIINGAFCTNFFNLTHRQTITIKKVQIKILQKIIIICKSKYKDRTVVRALASHKCGPGSNHGVNAICGCWVWTCIVLVRKDKFRQNFKQLRWHILQDYNFPVYISFQDSSLLGMSKAVS